METSQGKGASMKVLAPPSQLSRWERGLLCLLLLVVIAWGGYTELRSAFLSRRMGDVGVFLRAGWAVRSGAELYDVTDNNQWHYNYPPLFAILMAPLADAPAGVERVGLLPFALSVAIFYVLSLVCLAVGVHYLAKAVEESPGFGWLQRPWRDARAWWWLRVLPVLVCLPPIGHTLLRGQVNLLLLGLLCALAAATIRNRPWQAGGWLSAAICLKVIPAFLLLFPLWRRDYRCLAGCALGLLVGLGVVPVMVLGPEHAITCYKKFYSVVLSPGLDSSVQTDRARELIEVTATDSQSLQAMIHNASYLDRYARPSRVSPGVTWTARAIAGLMTLVTLWAAGWHPGRSSESQVLFLGGLIVCMLLLSPVCHLHYFCLCLPLVMGIVLAAWQRRAGLRVGPGLACVFVFNLIVNVLPHFQGLELFRDVGLATTGTLLLWGLAVVGLVRRRREDSRASRDMEGQYIGLREEGGTCSSASAA